MSIRSFFKLVEIQTKIASVFPFLIGILFVLYQYQMFDIKNTLIFFFAMLVFDLTTTAINNYMDYRKATNNHEYDFRKESNVIGRANIPEKNVLTVILTMFAIATGLGIWLALRTDLLVLAIGVLCFGIGIFYTFGPIPLSRMPLGELFSGVTMGLGITFLAIYASAYEMGIANIEWIGYTLTISFDLIEIAIITLIAFPSIFTIANLMLANNICDLEEDILNHRYTLPFYLGKKASIILFQALYYGAYIAIIAAVFLNVFHPLMLVVLVTFIPVQKNLMLFRAKQEKAETFVVAVKNLILINGAMVILLLISNLIS